MVISHTTQDEKDILIPQGRIDTLTSPELEAAIQPLLSKEHVQLTIDFQDVSYISSAGLRVIVKAAQTAKAKGGEVGLTHLNESVAQVLEITGFQSLFNIQ